MLFCINYIDKCKWTKMSDLTGWEVDEDSFKAITEFTKNNLYAFKHNENEDMEVKFVGYISDEPGIIYDITNVYSFTEHEIAAWKTIFTNYGASKVDIGIDTLNKIITIYVYYNPKTMKKSTKKWPCSSFFSVFTYIPTFVYVYICLSLIHI